MFGYVKPYRPELRVWELELYKGVYCGLCRELGRQFGPLARLTLSYDFAFLAILGMALTEEEPRLCPRRCLLHPFRRRPCCAPNESQRFAAAAGMLLFYYKCRDDLADRGFGKKLRAALLYPLAKAARKRALASSPRLGKLDEAAAEMMRAQAALEAEDCALPDRAAEPTALFLQAGLESLARDDGAEKRVLARLGYLLGRYIYLCDALDDLAQDRRRGDYNPFLAAERREGPAAAENAREAARGALFLTVAEFSPTLELLDCVRCRSLLENILCLGLKAEVERLYQTGKEERL